MKKQDIAALIDGKIKGQGSAIDIGGALPQILGGLNENSVSDDMEETEQMQLRKELGLYYEETTEEEKQAQYDAETSYIVADYGTARLTEDVPEPEDIVDVLYEGEHVDFTVSEKQFGGFTVSVGEGLSPDMRFDVRETAQSPTYPTPGVWITISEFSEPDKYTLVYKASETVVSKVPEKFLPAAPVPDEVEGNPTVPGGTSPTPLENLRINDNYFSIPQGGGGASVVMTGIPGPAAGQEYASPSWAAAQSFAEGDLDKLFNGDANTAIYSYVLHDQTYEDTFFVTRNDVSIMNESYEYVPVPVLVLWGNNGPAFGIVRQTSSDTMFAIGLRIDVDAGSLLGYTCSGDVACSLNDDFLEKVRSFFDSYKFVHYTKFNLSIVYNNMAGAYLLAGVYPISDGTPQAYRAVKDGQTNMWGEEFADITIGSWS